MSGKYWLSDYIKKYPNCHFINIVDQGVVIEGAENITVDKAETLLWKNVDVRNHQHTIVQMLSKLTITKDKLVEYLSGILSSLRCCLTAYEHLCEDNQTMQERLRDGLEIPGDLCSPETLEEFKHMLKEEAYIAILQLLEDGYERGMVYKHQQIVYDDMLSKQQKLLKILDLRREKHQFLSTVIKEHIAVIENSLSVHEDVKR